MNNQTFDILNDILDNPYTSQRVISQRCGHSLGAVNGGLKTLSQEGYLDGYMQPTEKAKALALQAKPRRAVILAAGFGMRMVPINTQTPKALLEVRGEPLIERLIRQLHAVDVTEIRVVVGFMKEHFDYLIDEYGVELVCNTDYASKNNLHSLSLVADYLEDSYIVPCDIWCEENPFRTREFYPWYMVTDSEKVTSSVRANRKRELVPVSEDQPGNNMVGFAYLPKAEGLLMKENIRKLQKENRGDSAFWEHALFAGNIQVNARIATGDQVQEINTYEQLRALDRGSNHLHSDAISTIMSALGAKSHQITDITVLKKGMTNRSFLFRCKGKQYIMRIPGEGTDQLINRKEEAEIYHALDGRKICDDIAYINPDNGYKITEFLEGARVCDPCDAEDIAKCMARLRQFHEQKLTVQHTFNIFGQIDFYESLWNGAASCFRDYKKTKEKILSLQTYIDSQPKNWCLTHIDAVPDNFLFTKDGQIRLIDWEYAGMQDPHVDIAMFCIYALYDRDQVEALIDAYFPEGCAEAVRTKIYCYIAACGLLWSNWCEYKRQLGVEFGEYSLRQYRYAKDYYKIATARMGKEV